MEIKLDLKIILFAILFYFTRQLHIYILFMTFALMHEISHVVIATILGYKLKTLKIMPIGFSIYLKTNLKDYNEKIIKGTKYNLKQIFISLAGPFLNIIIMLITLCINSKTNLITEIIYINAIIAIFNLMPVYPLDGSKILNNLLKILYENKKAYRYTYNISRISLIIFTIVSEILLILTKNIAILLILMYLWYAENQKNKLCKIREKIYEKS